MMKKLDKSEIKFINEFLIKFEVKYIDVRLELIDHIATEFEEIQGHENLQVFLNSKRFFIKKFIDKRQKTIHWSYQGMLWKKFFEFFLKKNLFAVLILNSITIYLVSIYFDINHIKLMYLISISFPQIISIVIHYRHNNLFKKVQSAQPLLAIMALPSLFMHVPIIIGYNFFSNYYVLMFIWNFGFLLSLAGLIIFHHQKSKIINQYKRIIT